MSITLKEQAKLDLEMTGRPAWYIVPGTSWWARWFNILHWPYTLWHLSYPVLGATLADDISWPLVGWTVLAFFFGMGVSAHCMDLLKGDPLRLALPRKGLWTVAMVSLTLAAAIGYWQWVMGNVPTVTVLLIIFGLVIAAGYNLEWKGMHGDWQFATWWAVFPVLVGYFAQGLDHHPALVLVLVFAFASAYAQRVLSTRARYLRRSIGITEVNMYNRREESDFIHMVDHQGKAWLLAPLDRALLWMTVMMVTLAGGMATFRLMGW